MKLKKIQLFRPILLEAMNKQTVSDKDYQIVFHKDMVWLKSKKGEVRVIPLANIEHMIPMSDAPKGIFDELSPSSSA